ncbi:hypothetical protein HS088_TW13G01560 [Tripterygium wilfordii]|uniref:Uncharacterized protein n=1 Tax=Tripterygium wilfordii TaxID=458696 RepID=A0A7J7CXJ2_TRIWF|nr:hypothetical protein HS088_TW13G01560 [Tripterygium wilfordii]
MSRAGFKDISLPIRKSKSESDDFRKLYHGLRSYDQPIENPADCFTEGGNLIPAAVWLSLKLDEISNKQMKWKIISDVLLERLLYVASQWKGNEHAQQLRRGGELLTHVWLLIFTSGENECFASSLAQSNPLEVSFALGLKTAINGIGEDLRSYC